MSWLRLMEESIKENESAADMESGAIPTPATRKKHSVSGLIRDMWPAYVIEIFVIILGISVSLALEQWQERNKETRLENIYLNNLLVDVEVDLQSLRDVTLNTQKILDRGNELLGYAGNPAKDISSKKLYADVRSILGRPKFLSSDATFSDLKSSGNIQLLKDIQLKNLLFAYYNQTQSIKEVQDAEQLATITLSGSYFLKRFPIDDSDSLLTKSLPDDTMSQIKNFEFGNNVLLRVLTRKELLQDYQRADSLAIQLKNKLTEKTGSH